MKKYVIIYMALLIIGCAHKLPDKEEALNVSRPLAEFKKAFDNLSDTGGLLSLEEANSLFGPDVKEAYEAMSSCPNAKYSVKEGGAVMLIFFKHDKSRFYMTSAVYSNQKGDREFLFPREP